MTLWSDRACRSAILSYGLLSLVGAGPALTQSRPPVEPIPISTLLSARQFAEYSPVAFSRDGRWIAYVLRTRSSTGGGGGSTSDLFYRTGVDWNAIGASIWVADTKTGAQREVTAAWGNSWMPEWSPDGRYLAFVSDHAASQKARQAHVWLWERGSDRLRLFSPLPVRALGLVWARDGRQLLVQLLPEGTTPDAYAAAAQAVPAGTPHGNTHPGATVTIYRSQTDTSARAPVEGGWRLDTWPVDLAWLSLATGAVERVARGVTTHQVRLSPDGARVAYTVAKRFEQAGSQQILWDLVVVDTAGPKVVATDIRLNGDGAQFTWAPDSRRLAYRTAGALANGEVYLVGLDGGAPHLISPAPHPKFSEFFSSGPLWDAHGEHVYFVDHGSVWRASAANGPPIELAKLGDRNGTLFAQQGHILWSRDNGASTIVLTRQKKTGRSGLARVDLVNGAVTQLVEEDKYYGGYGGTDTFGIAPDGGQLVFAAQDAGHSPDLYAWNPDRRSAQRLTTINPELNRYVTGERRIIEWRTIDGDPARGVLLLPAGYQAGTRYPLITKVYGGSTPSADDANRFGVQLSPVDNLQLFATRGYAVFLPDIPLNQPGEVMADLAKVVLPGVDKLVEMNIADPARLGLTGHSFGGYNTLALLTETTRFRAAMMNAGLADAVAAYGQMAPDGTTYGIAVIEHGQYLMNGTPWEQRMRYLENSPIYYLDRVQTPLLIIHGGSDQAVAPWLADEVFVGLRRLGKEVVYAKYAGEDHHQASWSYANQVDYWARVLDWFDHRIGTVRAAAVTKTGGRTSLTQQATAPGEAAFEVHHDTALAMPSTEALFPSTPRARSSTYAPLYLFSRYV